MGCLQSKREWTAPPLPAPVHKSVIPVEARLLIMRYILNHQVLIDGKPPLADSIGKMVDYGFFVDRAEAFDMPWERFMGFQLDAVYACPEYLEIGEPDFRIGLAESYEFQVAVIRLYIAATEVAANLLRMIQRNEKYRPEDNPRRPRIPTARQLMQLNFVTPCLPA